MKYCLLILVSIFFLLRTYDSAPGEFTSADIAFIIVFFIGAILLQIGLVYVLRRFTQVQNLLVAVFVVFNTFVLHVLMIGSFLAQGWIVMGAIALVNIFVVKILLDIFQGYPKFALAVVSGLAVVCVGSFGLTLVAVQSKSTEYAATNSIESPNLQHVQFAHKPNFYFVAFDSFQSRSMLQKYMGLEGTAYHDVFEKEFRLFKNSFADAVPTLLSLNSVLSLDMQLFRSKSMRQKRVGMFSGLTPSPLLQIFKQNGYVTNTVYNTKYFGKLKGPHVDKYWVNSKFSVCEFLDSYTSVIGFFGYCSFSKSRLFKKYTQKHGLGSEPNKMTYLLNSIRSGLENETPQIFVGYIYSPGHTAKGFRYNDKAALAGFKKQYVEESKTAADHLQRLLDFLKNEDPEGILIVFGDHGPWLSRGLKPTKKHLEFFVLDRYAVLGGIYPKNACKGYVDTGENKFMTPINAVLDTIKCLALGKQANIGPTNGQIKGVKARNLKGNTRRVVHYDEFLYE